MKKQFVKKMAAALAGTMLMGSLVACGGGSEAPKDSAPAAEAEAAVEEEAAPEAESLVADPKGGKILLLNHITSGPLYEFYNAFYSEMFSNLGYTFESVAGDGSNDPQGNLTNIRNAYTDDVVGIIACMDGGLADIMMEYPDVYVVAMNNDMDSAFTPGGANESLLTNDHFLGAMADNFVDGADLGELYAQQVIDRGFTKVSTCIFPPFAYPKHTAADTAFRAKIEEYNATASEPIEVVGDATVLMFKPIDSSYFMEEQNQDLDAIVGFCAGQQMIYPELLSSKQNGLCAERTKIITGGFENDEGIYADMGDEGNIISLTVAAPESAMFAVAMLDNAIQGLQYSDYAGPERMNSGILTIDSTADFQAIHENCAYWDADMNKSAISWPELQQYLLRYNADATYAGLCEKAQSFSMDSYIK